MAKAWSTVVGDSREPAMYPPLDVLNDDDDDDDDDDASAVSAAAPACALPTVTPSPCVKASNPTVCACSTAVTDRASSSHAVWRHGAAEGGGRRDSSASKDDGAGAVAAAADDDDDDGVGGRPKTDLSGAGTQSLHRGAVGVPPRDDDTRRFLAA